MDFFQNMYYSRVRNVLRCTGTWPYDQSYAQKCIATAAITYLWHFLFLQVARIITAKGDLEIIVDVIPTLLANTLIIVKFMATWTNTIGIRNVLDHFKNDWVIFTAEEEVCILKKQAEKTRFIGHIYLYCIQTTLIILVLQQLSPAVLDIVIPLSNRTWPRRHMFEIEYFVDRSKYYYPIVLHMVVAVQIAVWTLVGTDMVYISCGLHACGMSIILGKKFEAVFKDDTQHVCNNIGRCNMEQKIRHCLKVHGALVHFPADPVTSCPKTIFACSATFCWMRLTDLTNTFHLRFTKDVNASFYVGYATQSIIVVVGLTLIFFRLFKSLLFRDPSSAVIHIMYIIAFCVPTTIVALVGQMLLNCSSDLYQAIYRGQWYMGCRSSQKSLIIALRMALEPLSLYFVHTATMSLSTLSGILRAPVSYFTVLCSMYTESNMQDV